MDARLVAAVNAAGDTAMIEAGLEFRLARDGKFIGAAPVMPVCRRCLISPFR